MLFILEFFLKRTQVEFQRPSRAVLLVQHEKCISNSVNIKCAVFAFAVEIVCIARTHFVAINGSVNNHMSDMNALRVKLRANDCTSIRKAPFPAAKAETRFAAQRTAGTSKQRLCRARCRFAST